MGNIKGPLTNFLNPTLMEGFYYVNMINYSKPFLLMIEDMKLFEFYQCLPSMIGYLFVISFHGIVIPMVVEYTCNWFLLMFDT